MTRAILAALAIAAAYLLARAFRVEPLGPALDDIDWLSEY